MTQNRALLSALGGFFLWVVADTAIKWCSEGQGALSAFAIMAVLGLSGAASLAGASFLKGEMTALLPRSRGVQAVIALCSIAINYANVMALKNLPLTVFYIVVFTTPLVIAALSALLRHETLTPIKIGCLAAGFMGAVMAIGVKDGGGQALGYLAAAVSVTCFSLSTILMRKISRIDTVASTQFLDAACVGGIGLLGLAGHGVSFETQGTTLLIMLAAGGINVVGNVLYNTAIQNTASTNVAQLHYTQIVSGAFLGYVLWNEVPSWPVIGGSVLIIAAGLVMAMHARRDQVLASLDAKA